MILCAFSDAYSDTYTYDKEIDWRLVFDETSLLSGLLLEQKFSLLVTFRRMRASSKSLFM